VSAVTGFQVTKPIWTVAELVAQLVAQLLNFALLVSLQRIHQSIKVLYHNPGLPILAQAFLSRS
jgi:hypothetical protein